MVDSLQAYASHLESSFLQIKLPPIAPGSTVPPNFDLSQAYFEAVDSEFTRVYEEYTRRVATVQNLSEQIIQLWAELGTPQAQTDSIIIQNYKESPEQLGLHEVDINSLRAKRDKLSNDKKNRELKLEELKQTVEGLWERLGIDEYERKSFLNSNRGCGVRQINEFEDELARLNELKRQNLHLFVEDARYKLQEIWDTLYFSEEEMLEFTPAFSDVYTDALLDAHEQEITRLETLKEQRAPILALIEKHRSLVKDRDELAASSQDASRLMMRGQKGEKRDPTRLLREEKMRKRIAKELPKVAIDVRKALEKWEDEYGREFKVHGERYIHELDASEAKQAGPRAKTPAGPAAPTLSRATSVKSTVPLNRSQSTRSTMQPPPSRSGAKTPGGPDTTVRKSQFATSVVGSVNRSPTRIPTQGQPRAPLSNLKHGINSPERNNRSVSRLDHDFGTLRKMAPPSRGPPPKMRDVFAPPETPMQEYRHVSVESAVSVRPVALEDPYSDERTQPKLAPRPQSYHPGASMRYDEHRMNAYTNYPVNYAAAPPSVRHTSVASSHASSGTTHSNVASSTDNWESYDTDSEACSSEEAYRQSTIRGPAVAAQYKRGEMAALAGDGIYGAPSQSKRLKALHAPPMKILGRPGNYGRDAGADRLVSGSEANWTDDGDAF